MKHLDASIEEEEEEEEEGGGGRGVKSSELAHTLNNSRPIDAD